MRMKMGQDAQEKTQCPNCHQIAHWNILRVLRFFTLFFIPLIPYRMQYFMICPSCDAAVKIKGAEAKARAVGGGAIEAHTSAPQMSADSAVDEHETSGTSATRYEPFLLPTEQIVQIEKKIMRRSTLALAGLVAILLFLWFRDAMQYGITHLFAAIGILGFVIAIPSEYVQLNRRRRTLPQQILIRNGDLWIDNQRTSIFDIKAATMTSMKLRGSSFRPKQRFLTLKTDTEKKRYWLGNSSSLHDSEYAKLSDMLRRGLNEYGVALTYSSKKSIQDHLNAIDF